MRRTCHQALLACVVFAIAMSAEAAPRASENGSSQSLFVIFQSLDNTFTDLQEQFRAMETAFQKEEHEAVRTRLWVAPAKKLRRDIRSVERTAHGLRRYYRHSHWGRRVFLALEKKSQRMSRETDELIRAQSAAAAKSAIEKLRREMLPLLVQFQALTTNYGALHCDTGQTACCEPKKREAEEKIPEHECKWVCVKHRTACRGGIPGPTTRSTDQVPVR